MFTNLWLVWFALLISRSRHNLLKNGHKVLKWPFLENTLEKKRPFPLGNLTEVLRLKKTCIQNVVKIVGHTRIHKRTSFSLLSKRIFLAPPAHLITHKHCVGVHFESKKLYFHPRHNWLGEMLFFVRDCFPWYDISWKKILPLLLFSKNCLREGQRLHLFVNELKTVIFQIGNFSLGCYAKRGR